MAASLLTCLTIGGIQTYKGSKSASVCFINGNPAIVNFPAMQVAFEPAHFSDPEASRVNIVWRPTQEVEEMLKNLDTWVLTQAKEHSVQWFGKQRSEESIHESYVPVLKSSDRYASTFKAKMNIEPPNQVRVWGDDKQLVEPPTTWLNCITAPRIEVKSVWFMGTQFGLVLECTDLRMCREEATFSCPF